MGSFASFSFPKIRGGKGLVERGLGKSNYRCWCLPCLLELCHVESPGPSCALASPFCGTQDSIKAIGAGRDKLASTFSMGKDGLYLYRVGSLPLR